MSFKPYSFSKLNTWTQCPRKFKYNYIDKVEKENSDVSHLLKGGAIHSILENYPNLSNHKLAKNYQPIVDEFLKSGYKELFYLPNTRELPIALSNSFEPLPYSNDVLFRGYIDFIAIKDNKLILVDWKSGKYKDEKYQDFSQLTYYAIYMFNKYTKIEEIEIKYIYIEHNLDNSVTLLRKNLTIYEEDLKEKIKKLEVSTFEKNPSALCEYCDYNKHCSNDL